jgi:endonuclease YncB( thermonuclease family)
MAKPSRKAILAGLLALTLGTVLGLTAVSAGAGAKFVDRDCSDFSSQASAQAFFVANGGPASDPHGLDADHDGVACESNSCPCGPSTAPTTPPPTTTTTTSSTTNTQPPTTTTAVPPQVPLKVVRVVDGDTLELSGGGVSFTVRLIGIDTPETVKPGTPIECGGPQATRSLEALARPGDVVQAIADPTQDLVDIYGRSLRYVQEQGVDYAKHQVAAGWAKPYVYETPFTRLATYRNAASKARRGDLGVWRRCGGNFHTAH